MFVAFLFLVVVAFQGKWILLEILEKDFVDSSGVVPLFQSVLPQVLDGEMRMLL